MSIREKLIKLGVKRGFDKKEIEEFVSEVSLKSLLSLDFEEFAKKFKKYFGFNIKMDRDIFSCFYFLVDTTDLKEKLDEWNIKKPSK